MQDFSSTVSFSPSFSFYASGDGDVVEAATRVVSESHTYYSVKVDGDDAEFEFETSPLREESFFHFPTTATFERSSDDRVTTSKTIFYGGWNTDPTLSSPSQSHSTTESDDSDDPFPSRYYCFWSPTRSPARGDSSSKSNSSSGQRRCRFKDLLRRSHSNGAVPTSTEAKQCRFKDLLRRSSSDGGDGSSTSSSGIGSPTAKDGNNKTASHKPTNIGEVDKKRRKTFLPYRQNLIGVFAGTSRLRH